MLDIAVAKPALPKSGALVLLLAEGSSPDSPTGAVWKAADEATGGAISRALSVAEFTGKKGQSAAILAPGASLSRVIAIGIGPLDKADGTSLEAAGGIACAALAKEPAASIATSGLSPELAASVALGAVLRAYRFDRYRTKEAAEDKPKLAKLTLLADAPAKVKSAWAPLKGVAEGVFVARDLVSEPPNVLNPAEMTRRIQALSALGLKIEVLGPKDMKKLGFGALLGVAQGSTQDAFTVIMHWTGAPADKQPPLCFVGKGVTFDTGGISLKDPAAMDEMKYDMCGAGSVLAAMSVAAQLKLPLNVVGLIAAAENMPGSRATKPGDIVTSAAGLSIEILNTDAEGRLVLCDALDYARRYKPAAVVDIATLTGACVIALGHHFTGIMGNDDHLARELVDAGARADDRGWQLPLTEDYAEQLKSNFADLANVGGRDGGAITAGAFLGRFTQGLKWAHLDIAGTAWLSGAQKGGTGRPLPLLADFLIRRAGHGA